MKTRIFALIALVLIINGCGYQNYDECMLSEMKGQQASMQITAEKVCERKFPYEKEIYSSRDGEFDLGWSETAFNAIVIKVESNETDYQITKAKMKFSTKPCDQSKIEDFSNILVFEFGSNVKSEVNTNKASQFKCMRKDAVYGIIK